MENILSTLRRNKMEYIINVENYKVKLEQLPEKLPNGRYLINATNLNLDLVYQACGYLTFKNRDDAVNQISYWCDYVIKESKLPNNNILILLLIFEIT